MGKLKEGLEFFGATLIASVILIVFGIVYLGLSLWIMKTASNIFFGPGLTANWAVLSATLLSVGALLAGALEQKRSRKK